MYSFPSVTHRHALGLIRSGIHPSTLLAVVGGLRACPARRILHPSVPPPPCARVQVLAPGELAAEQAVVDGWGRAMEGPRIVARAWVDPAFKVRCNLDL